MNKKDHFSNVLPSIYRYSYAYELEYSSCDIILIYELVCSLYVMMLSYRTLCLIIHIMDMIRNRAKLRWRFIVPSGVPKLLTCRSVGSGTRGAWVASLYTSMVLGYIEAGECIVLVHG
jgi:hypothetical protein